jgi:predicted O-methyltransferase YrrM
MDTIDEIYEEIKDIGQWFSREDIESFSKLEIPPEATILELGTGSGRSTKVLSILFPGADITTCDPRGTDLNIIKDINSKSVGENLRVKFILDYGFNLDWSKPIDLLFVDDDHQTETVLQDISKYEPFIKKGGYIVFHDYYGTGVKEAVDLVFPGARIIQTGEFSQAIWRNK